MRRFTPLALGWAVVLGGIGLVQLFAWASSAQRIFALMSGRRGGCVPPYASIDSRWCFDFGVRSGRTLGNESFKC